MNLKIIMAVFIAAFMVVPCAAAMDATTVFAEDDSSKLAVGDAWGISYSGDKDDLIEFLLNGEEIPEEDLEMYELINSAIKSANLYMALIIEVVRADESGYTLTVDGGARFKLSVKYNENIIKEPDAEELIANVNGYIDVIVLIQGKINLDADSMITGVNLDLNMIVDSEVTTNLDLIMLNEFMDSEDDALTIYDIFTDTNKTSKIKIGASASYNMHSIGESGVTPNYDENEGITSYTIVLDGKQSIRASIFAIISGDLADLLMEDMDDDSDFIVDGTVRGSMSIYETSTEYSDFTIDASEMIEDLMDDEDLEIPEHIDGLFLAIEEQFSMDSLFLEVLQVNREGDYYLSNTKEVRNIFDSMKGAYGVATSSIEFIVTYNIDDAEDADNPTQKVKFNGYIRPPAVPDNDEGEKFVGWETDEGTEWNTSWGIKGDLSLSPIYAENFTDAGEMITHMKSNPSQYGYMKINDVDDLIDAFEDGDFEFDGTMFIDVYDGNKFLYSWKITNDGTALEYGTIMKLNIDKDDLTADQRKILADGRNSGEGSFMYIKFGASGTMPGTTTVTYNVSDTFEDGTNLQIYYVIIDGEGNIIGLEPVRNVTVVNGMAVFDIDHCSGYVLSSMVISDAGSDNTLLLIGAVIVAIIMIVSVAMIFRRGMTNRR